MRETVAAVAAGEVTRASRDVQLNGVAIRNGEWLGLADGDPVAGGDDFVDVTLAVVDHLLSEPRSLLTLLTGAEPPRARRPPRPRSPRPIPTSRSRCTTAASLTTRC